MPTTDKNNPFEIKNPLFQEETDNEPEPNTLKTETLPTDDTNPMQTPISVPAQPQAEFPSSDIANPLYLGEGDDDDKKKAAKTENPPKTPTDSYVPSPDEWLDIEGRRLKVPRNLRHSIFKYESGKRQTDKNGNLVVSPKGAEGYTQILPDTAKGEGFPQAGKNVYDNISGGVSYLRKGFDIAKKKGYSDEDAWYMAARGYLNGQNRQEATISDRNVNTDQYEAAVKANWEKRIKETGEREDDWNDPAFLSPLEIGGESGKTSAGSEAEAGLTAQNSDGLTDGINQSANLSGNKFGQAAGDALAKEDKSIADAALRKERDNRTKEYLTKNFEPEVAVEIFDNLQSLSLQQKRGYTADDVNQIVRQKKRQRILQPEELKILAKNVGQEKFSDYRNYLTATKGEPTLDSLNKWQIAYNRKNAANPTALPVRIPYLPTGTSSAIGVDDTAIDLLDADPNLTGFNSAVSGENSSEILAKTYSAVAKNGNPASRTAKGGFEEFVKNSGLSTLR